MPPTRKPAGQRQRRNADGVGQLTVAPAAGLDAPVCPKAANGKVMLKATREAWAAFWGSQVSNLIDVRSDLPALTRLFRLYDEVGRVDNHVGRHGRLSKGSTGQVALDPLYKHATSLRAEITQLEDRFGLSPMARLKLGAQLGAAHESLDRMNQAMDQPDDDEAEDADDPRRLAAIPSTAG